MSTAHEETVEVSRPEEDVFGAALAGVGGLSRAAVRAAEPTVGLIVAVKPLSFRSFGEVIMVQTRAVDAGRTSVWVWSESFQIYDPFRVNESNVTAVIDAIRRGIASEQGSTSPQGPEPRS